MYIGQGCQTHFHNHEADENEFATPDTGSPEVRQPTLRKHGSNLPYFISSSSHWRARNQGLTAFAAVLAPARG